MLIRLEDITYVYEPDSANPVQALSHISLEIAENQFVGIIGHTGSGKSTLIQMLNGLLHPTSGRVCYEGHDICEKGYSLKELRSQVGLVFQYPEYQLFCTEVLEDVCFGPKNQGCSLEEQKERAKEALRLVGMSEDCYEKSPFELSGGQKRRVAIAGVLAMNPKVLVLDEPTAGLDPRGRDEILDQIAFLQRERNMTVVLVSHSMEDVARYASRLIVIDQGQIQYDDTPAEVFRHAAELETFGLAVPQVSSAAKALRDIGIPLSDQITTVYEAEREIYRWYCKEKEESGHAS